MGDVLATVSVAGGDRLIKSSLYRYIALQLGHFLKFPSAQFWKEQMTHQMRVVLDYWESYGKDESEPGWAIRLMTEGAFKRADLPDNPAHAVSLWIDGALWLGCDFAGPTDAQRELKHKREKILERIIAAHVENPGFDRTAERVGKNTLRMRDALVGAARQYESFSTEASLIELLKLLDHLTNKDTSGNASVLAYASELVPRLVLLVEEQRQIREALAKSEGGEAGDRFEGLLQEREELNRRLARASAALSELTDKPISLLQQRKAAAHESLVVEQARELEELRGAVETLTETVKRGLPLSKDDELDELLSELVVIAQEIPALTLELERAKAALSTEREAHGIAVARLESGETEGDSLEVMQRINEGVVSSARECARIRDLVRGLEIRQVEIMGKISARVHQLYAASLASGRSRPQDGGAQGPGLDPVAASQQDIWTLIDSLERPDDLLEARGCNRGVFSYYKTRGLLPTLSGFIRDIGSREIWSKMDDWVNGKKIMRKGKENLTELVRHAITLSFFAHGKGCAIEGPHHIDTDQLVAQYRKVLKKQDARTLRKLQKADEQSPEPAVVASAGEDPLSDSTPTDPVDNGQPDQPGGVDDDRQSAHEERERASALAFLSQLRPFEFLMLDSARLGPARGLSTIIMHKIVGSLAEALLKAEDGLLVPYYRGRAHELGWDERRVGHHQGMVEEAEKALYNLPIWKQGRTPPNGRFDPLRLTAHLRAVWSRYRKG